MSVDYNPVNKFVSASKKLSGGSPGSFFGVSAKGNRGRTPGAYTRRHQSVVKNGGHASAKTIPGTKGLHVTKVNRPAKATGKPMGVTAAGGHPSRAIVQSKPRAVKVRPEC